MDHSKTLVVSGKVYPNVSVIRLIDSSLYFRALLSGNHADSVSPSYKFEAWSSSAFSVILQYMVTGKIDLRNRDLAVLRKSLEMADYLLVGAFKTQLARTLISSWTDMKSEYALELATDLGVLQQLKEHSMQKVLNANEQEPSLNALQRINYELLTLVTGMEEFWTFDFEKKNYRSRKTYYSIRDDAIQRYRDVLNLAVQIPVHRGKLKALVQNLPVEYWNSKRWSAVMNMLHEPGIASRYVTIALEDRLVDLRQNLRSKISQIRIAYSEMENKIQKFCVLVFDFNSWSWEIQKHESKFCFWNCVMNKGHTTFIGNTGLFVISRNRNQGRLIEDAQFRALSEKWEYSKYCFSEDNMFSLVPSSRRWWTLVRYNMSEKTLTKCVQVKVFRPELIRQGNNIYIVAYGVSILPKMKVFKYCITTKRISLMLCVKISSRLFESKVAKFKNKIYVFSEYGYYCLDLQLGEDQNVGFECYKGLVCELWDFILLDICCVSTGIILFLRSDLVPVSYMIAQFNPHTNELKGLGVLPPVNEEGFSYDIYHNWGIVTWAKLEARKKRDCTVQDTAEILRKLRSFRQREHELHIMRI